MAGAGTGNGDREDAKHQKSEAQVVLSSMQL